MGILGFIASNIESDDVYFLGRMIWRYNMLTINNTWNLMYYGWRFRNRIYQELSELILKYYNSDIKKIEYKK